MILAISYLLKDVHAGVPRSGVSGGLMSTVEGSYEYYHYLQDGFDDNCRLTWKFNRPSLRLEIKILLLLVHVNGIGAIELSFVLDKLLGVGCKIMNVRSGAELPEKCQEVGLAFRDTRNSCNDWW